MFLYLTTIFSDVHWIPKRPVRFEDWHKGANKEGEVGKERVVWLIQGDGHTITYYLFSWILLQCRRRWFDSWVGKICWRRDRLPTPVFLGFPCGSAGKESTCNARDLDSIPGLGRSPGAGTGNPLQYSGLENSMDCIVHGILQALEWVVFPFSRGSSQPRDWIQVSCIAGGFFISWATGKPNIWYTKILKALSFFFNF